MSTTRSSSSTVVVIPCRDSISPLSISIRQNLSASKEKDIEYYKTEKLNVQCKTSSSDTQNSN
jgi:hypothetical protein